MEFKPDWEEAQPRMLAWWEGDVLDRVAIQIEAPRADAKPHRNRHNRVSANAGAEERLDWAEEHFANTYFGGEAFPLFWPNFGPDIFAAYLGCPLSFGEEYNTSWSHPIVENWIRDLPQRLDEANPWWQATLELTKAAVERGKDRFLVGLTDLHPGGDALVALRGPDCLCLDLIDQPEAVLTAVHQVEDTFLQVYERCYQILQQGQQGSSTWLSVWSPGRYYPTSCDLAALLSPAQFQEFFLPAIAREVDFLDHSLYHLDGPGAIHHLDSLLQLPRLNGIQWVPGAGQPGMTHWIPLLRRIQAAGKNLHLACGFKEVETLVRELSPRGLMLNTWAPSEEAARQLLQNLHRWTTDRQAG